MNNYPPSTYLAMASWLMVFIIAVFLFLKAVPSDFVSWFFFVFFFVIALFSSAISSRSK